MYKYSHSTVVVNQMKTMEVILEKIKIEKVHANFLYLLFFYP